MLNVLITLNALDSNISIIKYVDDKNEGYKGLIYIEHGYRDFERAKPGQLRVDCSRHDMSNEQSMWISYPNWTIIP